MFMIEIRRLTDADALNVLPELVALLQDAVDGGASVGFLPPLSADAAEAYWRGTLGELADGTRLLLVAVDGAAVVGTVQLSLAMKPNARHRAEVQKLMVLRSARNRGIGRRLMARIEDAARASGRTLLVLDTETGSPAESLYRKCGYTLAGVIPGYALSADGTAHPTSLFYHIL
jgi:GNAT superfamily N-acetyltransferase